MRAGLAALTGLASLTATSATGPEMRVVVVGGGVTGLSAAYELVHGTGLADDDIDVVVLEAGDRFGGKIHTSPFAGRPVDEAADAFLARVPDAVDLCRQLGLTDQLVTPATRQAHLYSLGQLRAFPDGLVLGVPTDLDALAASGAVSTEGVARAGQDLTMGPDRGPTGAGRDESVGELVRRRVGDEVFERLVAPLLSGVHAGNADRLSVAAGAPAFAAALRDHDSLMAGLAAQRQAAVRRRTPPSSSAWPRAPKDSSTPWSTPCEWPGPSWRWAPGSARSDPRVAAPPMAGRGGPASRSTCRAWAPRSMPTR